MIIYRSLFYANHTGVFCINRFTADFENPSLWKWQRIRNHKQTRIYRYRYGASCWFLIFVSARRIFQRREEKTSLKKHHFLRINSLGLTYLYIVKPRRLQIDTLATLGNFYFRVWWYNGVAWINVSLNLHEGLRSSGGAGCRHLRWKRYSDKVRDLMALTHRFLWACVSLWTRSNFIGLWQHCPSIEIAVKTTPSLEIEPTPTPCLSRYKGFVSTAIHTEPLLWPHVILSVLTFERNNQRLKFDTFNKHLSKRRWRKGLKT